MFGIIMLLYGIMFGIIIILWGNIINDIIIIPNNTINNTINNGIIMVFLVCCSETQTDLINKAGYCH
jgi:hypothetical protein